MGRIETRTDSGSACSSSGSWRWRSHWARCSWRAKHGRKAMTKDAVAKLAEGGIVASKGTVKLEEYQIIPAPTQYKAGTVTLTVKNIGTMTHEMVLLRAPSAAALPKVATAGGERAVGDVDEEAIPKLDTIGETGDVKPGATVVKSFHLSPGTYVMICNIDDKQPDGSVISHFQRGMSATITVQ